MIRYLILSILFFLINPIILSSNWEELLRNPSKKDAQKNEKIRTSGLEANSLEKLEPSTDQDWVSKLTGSSKEPKKNLSPEVSDMLDKIAQMDRMMPDDSIAKHVLFSKFAGAFLHVGDFSKAEQIALRSIRMAERLSGKNSEATLSCRSNIALLYGEIGDYERALDFSLSCVEICEQNPKATGKHKAGFLTQAASFQVELGQLNQAEALLKNVTNAKQTVAHNNDISDNAKSLAVRASLASARGNYNESIDFLRLGLLDIRKQKFNKKNVGSRLEQSLYEGVIDAAYYGLLSELFQVLVASNRASEAREVLLEYNKSRNEDLDLLPSSLKTLKNIDAAKWAASKAILEEISGSNTDARKFAMEYLDFQNKNLDSVCLLVESQRLNWQRRYLDFSLPVAFCTAPDLANIVLAWKGIVLDSLSAERAKSKVSSNAANKDSLQEITRLRRQLAQMLIQNTEGSDEEIQFLKNKIFSAERALSKNSLADKKTSMLSWRALQERMSEDSAIVEFVSYRELPDIRNGKRHFGAVIILKSVDPIWIPIASAEEVESAIGHLQENIVRQEANESRIEESLRGAYELLFAKIEKVLPSSISKVYLSPEGNLNFVPFACLLRSDNSFLGEKYSVAYLGSARDLLKESKESIKNLDIQIIANPAFDVEQDAPPPSKVDFAQRAVKSTEFSEIKLSQLPGTEVEASHLYASAKDIGWKPQILTGNDASELNVCRLESPKILHFATHGFFLGGRSKADQQVESNRGMKVSATDKKELIPENFFALNPMLQSGIALAGAQSTLRAWGQGKAPDPQNDGILTAEEVSGLDLNGTWLVSLSACETGVGETRSGEGVFGLRRAFMMAGAQNLLMTLWPVNDASTAEFMADFYKRALSSKDAPQSLAETQRNWLVKLRKEQGLFAAVRDAGPFVLAATGNQ